MRSQILSDSFSARREAVRALWAVAKDQSVEHELHRIATDLDSLSAVMSSGAAAGAYSAFAGLLRVVDALVQWRAAVLGAQPESDRFLRSARERHRLWLDEYANADSARALVAAAEPLPTMNRVDEVASLAEAVAKIPLPIAFFQSELRPHFRDELDAALAKEAAPVDLTVAFVKFQFDGVAAIEVQHLPPGEVHDLEIEVRVSRWPAEQEALLLTPVSVEPKSTYDFPSFRLEKPSGSPPYTLHKRGRAILLLPQGMHARPFEFKYSAEFIPHRDVQPVAVVGHRTLQVEGIDASKFQVCGYAGLDRRLFDIRDHLRRRPGVPQDETADALLLLGPLCNLAGRAVQDAEFAGAWDEARFQSHVRAELRRHPLVGSHLDEHAHAAGGITDLSLRGVPIELKSDRTPVASADDCQKYFAQTASYAVAKGKRTAVLCVLDASAKSSAPLPPENLLDIQVHGATGITICVLVIQGNLAKPSALSR